MSLPEGTLKSLRGLIEKDPSLLAQLQQTNDAAQSAQLLVQAARAVQLDVDEAALRTHLESISRQANSLALDDVQLEAVAGGGADERARFIASSIFSLGISCALISRMVQLNGKPMQDVFDFGTVDYCVGS